MLDAGAPAPLNGCVTDALSRLQRTIDDRLRGGDPAASYVAQLARRGVAKVAQKVGEEAVETVIAALGNDDAAVIAEAADLVFHLTLLLRLRGLGWDDIAAELDRRDGISGLIEKAGRD